jgi:hypothetical protein
MTNYQLGKIYKIVCNTTGLTYYGSTCEPTLARRLANHRTYFKNWILTKKQYITSFKVLENDNYEIVLVELKPSDNKMELRMRERFHIENNQCVNKMIPIRDASELFELKKQYRDNNSDSIKLKKAAYHLEHREEILKRESAYCKTDESKEKRAIYRAKNIDSINEKRAIYRAKNKDKINAQDAIHRNKNKDKIAERNLIYRNKNKDKIAERDLIYRNKKKTNTIQTEIL